MADRFDPSKAVWNPELHAHVLDYHGAGWYPVACSVHDASVVLDDAGGVVETVAGPGWRKSCDGCHEVVRLTLAHARAVEEIG